MDKYEAVRFIALLDYYDHAEKRGDITREQFADFLNKMTDEQNDLTTQFMREQLEISVKLAALWEQLAPIPLRFRIGDYDWCEPDYRQILILAEETGLKPDEVIARLLDQQSLRELPISELLESTDANHAHLFLRRLT